MSPSLLSAIGIERMLAFSKINSLSMVQRSYLLGIVAEKSDNKLWNIMFPNDPFEIIKSKKSGENWQFVEVLWSDMTSFVTPLRLM